MTWLELWQHMAQDCEAPLVLRLALDDQNPGVIAAAALALQALTGSRNWGSGLELLDAGRRPACVMAERMIERLHGLCLAAISAYTAGALDVCYSSLHPLMLPLQWPLALWKAVTCTHAAGTAMAAEETAWICHISSCHGCSRTLSLALSTA